MAKPKLFAWSDMMCNTGFAKVAHNLYEDLHNDFDVKVLGINYHGLADYDTSKYFIYPISNDDPFGYNRMGPILHKARPDIIFLFQDIFNIIPAAKIVRQVLGPDVPIVAYYPIDGSPVSVSWNKMFEPGLIQKHITYSKWAVDEIKFTFPKESADKEIDILYHGVDPNVFNPLRPFHIKQIKREKGWNDKFTVINLNRCQPRKGIHHTIRAFAMLKYGYYVDKDGYWFPRTMTRHPLQHYTMKDIVQEVPGLDDVVMYLHSSPADRIFGPTKSCSLFAQVYNNGIKNEDFGKVLSTPMRDIMNQPFTDQEVNELYNAADVNISAAYGEGCGLSLIESASCGTTSIAPFNSAIPEMLGETGHLCKNITTFTQAMDNAHLRPIVDERELVKALRFEYDKWVANGRKKVFNQAALDRVDNLFRWEDKRTYLSKVLLEHVKR
ncbi:MAG: glycosyltransferase family 4 protein [Candidatus Pacearchaeota archaeon]